MAKNLRAIRKRIGSIKSTQQITRAMKMVAAAKLRRAQDRAVGSRPYLTSLTGIVSVLSKYTSGKAFELLRQRDRTKKAALLLYTSNRGLCGAFNSNLIRHAEELLNSFKNEGREICLFHVGKKGHDYFKKRRYSISKFYKEIRGYVTVEQASMIMNDLVGGYISGEFDKVLVVFSKFHSAAISRPRSLTLIPVELGEAEAERKIIFEPSAIELLEVLLPEFVKSKIMNAMLESYASEQGSRMTAMEAATSNAGKLIRSMTLEYNKARQASITQELIEIMSSAEAQRTE